jgi:hypothetical protein
MLATKSRSRVSGRSGRARISDCKSISRTPQRGCAPTAKTERSAPVQQSKDSASQSHTTEITGADLRRRAAHYRDLVANTRDARRANRYRQRSELLEEAADAWEGDRGRGLAKLPSRRL